MAQQLFYKLFRSSDMSFGVGYTPQGLYPTLRQEGKHYDEWKPVTFKLRDGILSDYLVNDLGWELCSPLLRSIIDQNASPSDAYEWLENVVVDQDGIRHTYYALHIPDRPDVLDEEWTDYGYGMDGKISKSSVVAPVLQRSKLGDRRLIRPRGCGTTFLAEPIVKAIRKAKCMGMKLKKTKVRET